MLPRWHILLGAIFSIALLVAFPQIGWFYAVLIFLSSFLIDFDHYAASFLKTNKISLRESFKFYKKEEQIEKSEYKRGIFIRGIFHLFHTVEFHLLVFFLGFIWQGFFYIFIGMLFHSVIDIIQLSVDRRIYRREFFFINWLLRKFKEN